MNDYDHPYIEPYGEMRDVWRDLAACHQRGIHVYCESRREFIYRSYAELSARALVVARRLKDYGIERGEHVLLCARSDVDFPLIWLGLIAIGAVPVPLPPRDAMLGKYAYRERMKHIVPHYRYFIADDDDYGEALAGASNLIKQIPYATIARDLETDEAIDAPVDLQRSDIAFVQYTSGSTSRPKGILVEYDNLFANAYAIWSRLMVNPERDGFATWLPMYHDMGLVGQFLCCLLSQTPLVMVSPRQFTRRPLHFLQSIERFGSNYCTMPNFALEWILKALERRQPESLDLSSLRWLGVGAEPISARTITRFSEAMSAYGMPSKAISPCYGLAETTLAVSLTPSEEAAVSHAINAREVVACGLIARDFEVKVADADEDGVGVLMVRGPSVVRRAFVDGEVISLLDGEGYYNTRDVGAVIDDHIYVLGRTDEMFNVNGENVFPYDLESVVRQHDVNGRKRAACFASTLSNDQAMQEIIMLVESSSVEQKCPDDVTLTLKEMVASQTGFVLDKVVLVPPKTIPVTPSGKIQRTAAKSLYTSGYYTKVALCGE